MKADTLEQQGRRWLVLANLLMLATITVHDADHLRQAQALCYRIPLSLWLINLAVYLPNAFALWASFRQQQWAPMLTGLAGLAIAGLFAKVHLWKPFMPVWGIWNQNFFQLQADVYSWGILLLTVMMGMATALVAAYVAGAQHPRGAAN